jgi:hypothetical protein
MVLSVPGKILPVWPFTFAATTLEVPELRFEIKIRL